MLRQEATELARSEMKAHGLEDWSLRLNQNANSGFLGMCLHRDKCLVLSAHHVDMHDRRAVLHTIRHEIAHALTPGHGHDDVWAAKAMEIGCDNSNACSNLSLHPDVIDAIRSGADVEVTFTEQVIRTPKFTITRLQDKCEFCGKVAKEVSARLVETVDEVGHDLKFITLECGHVIVKKIPKGTPFHKFQWGGDEKCEHNWEKNSCLKCGRYRPYKFQLEGMAFLEAALAVNNGGAIFDEMGLGKTTQSLGVILFHSELTPTLYVVKSGIKYQWSSAIINQMGTAYVPQIINSSKDWLIPGLKSYIIGYDMMVYKERTLKSGKTAKQGFDISQFDRIGIKCVVLDECQQIKNADSARTQMVRRVVKGRKVIPLSGTPWKNRGSELFPVFNMLDPVKFWSEERFRRQWVQTYWQGNQEKEAGIKHPKEFKEYTKDLCIRRERTEVMKELPLVNRTKLAITMTVNQEEAYDAAVEEFVKWFEEQSAAISGMQILGQMAKMRHLIAIAKIPATMDYIEEFIEETDRKLVIFVHHQDVGVEIMHRLTKLSLDEDGKPMFDVLQLTGSMNGEEKYASQMKFNRATRAIMVASTLAAGEGLNLQTCADCVMHERQWNPANEEQAEGRFIRIGQTATTVNAVYAHCEGLSAIDPWLDGIVERKRRFFHDAMNKGEMPTWSDSGLARELAEAIVSGHNLKKQRNKK